MVAMTVTVHKIELLDKMRDNRDTHRAKFLEAQSKYRERVIEELDKRLAEARNGGRINLGFALPEPVDYTDDYDQAIEMFTWHEGDSVVLDQEQFKQYVLDQWGWGRLFAANTLSYTQGAE